MLLLPSLLNLIVCARALEDIEQKSKALLRKTTEARFFDHRRDSGKVAKLVERLQQAVLIYQVGIPESHSSILD